MRDAGVFISSVLRHWGAWGTGGILVLAFGCLEYFGWWKLPKNQCMRHF
jgi:hypothetical protein